MPIATQAGSTVTGASVVDASLSTADLDEASLAELKPSCLSLIPWPNFPSTEANTGTSIVTATTMRVGQVVFPVAITANKISFRCDGVAVAGTAKIALYSEDGQTKLFEVTTGTISASGVITTALSSVVIPSGVYWIAILPVSTASFTAVVWNHSNGYDDAQLVENVASEPKLQGTITVTADTIPATITPTAPANNNSDTTLHFRLDN